MLLVLDQFEQWLHARRGEENTELVAALRQCDGEHVQAVVMVRDDFWLAASRFMRDLEIRLVEGENSAARRSLRSPPCPEGADGIRAGLRELARADAAISPGTSKTFLDQVDRGLAQDGKIISVRLGSVRRDGEGEALDPGHLAEVGGTEGVGVTFLEETFSASTGPSQASPPPESSPGGPESPPARERHRHQGADEITPGIAGSIGLCEPPQGLR